MARSTARLCASALLPALMALAPQAQGADIGISLSVVQPGVYGRIDIGPQYRPDVVYAEPVWIQRPRRVHRAPAPIYLYAPSHHVRDWGRYCGGYGACGQPVLFIEDVNEAEYRVDRMFQQLRLAGVLDGLAGVVFGQCTSCATTAPDYGGFTIDQVVDQYLGPLGIPALTGANVGHVSNQLSLPSGAEVELDADARTIRLLQPIVG